MGRRSEKSASEGLVKRRNSNEHKRFPRPDVKMVGRDGKRALGGVWGNDKLAPEGVDIFLLVVDPGVLHHMVPCGGVSAIRSNKDIEGNRNLSGAVLVLFSRSSLCRILGMVCPGNTGTLFEPCEVFVEVSTSKLVVEVESHVGHFA